MKITRLKAPKDVVIPKPKFPKADPATAAQSRAAIKTREKEARTGHCWLPCPICGGKYGVPEVDPGSGWNSNSVAYCAGCQTPLGVKIERGPKGREAYIAVGIPEHLLLKRINARLGKYYNRRTKRFLLRTVKPKDRIEPCCKRPHIKLSNYRHVFSETCSGCKKPYRLGNGPYRYGAWTGQRGEPKKTKGGAT